MIIGTLRPSEVAHNDTHAGYHQFHDETGAAFGSFEVFYHGGGHIIEQDASDDMPLDDWREPEAGGWYWWACHPGALPDGIEPNGPHASSWDARADADENWDADSE